MITTSSENDVCQNLENVFANGYPKVEAMTTELHELRSQISSLTQLLNLNGLDPYVFAKQEIAIIEFENRMFRLMIDKGEAPDSSDIEKDVAKLTASAQRVIKLREDVKNYKILLLGNIRIIARVRPHLPSDTGDEDKPIQYMKFSTKGINSKLDKTPYTRPNMVTVNKTTNYEFEDIFINDYKMDDYEAQNKAQDDIYQAFSFLEASILHNNHSILFAYGQTSAGKTFTMEGKPENNVIGLYTRFATSLLNMIDKPGLKNNKSIQFKALTISVLELDGFKPFDVATRISLGAVDIGLACSKISEATEDDDLKRIHDAHSLREEVRPYHYHTNDAVNVTKLSETPINSIDDVIVFMKKAIKLHTLTKSATVSNKTSSRNHLIVHFNLIHSGSSKKATVFTLVDLAGHEFKDIALKGTNYYEQSCSIASTLTILKTVVGTYKINTASARTFQNDKNAGLVIHLHNLFIKDNNARIAFMLAINPYKSKINSDRTEKIGINALTIASAFGNERGFVADRTELNSSIKLILEGIKEEDRIYINSGDTKDPLLSGKNEKDDTNPVYISSNCAASQRYTKSVLADSIQMLYKSKGITIKPHIIEQDSLSESNQELLDIQKTVNKNRASSFLKRERIVEMRRQPKNTNFQDVYDKILYSNSVDKIPSTDEEAFNKLNEYILPLLKDDVPEGVEVISKFMGFSDSILYNIKKKAIESLYNEDDAKERNVTTFYKMLVNVLRDKHYNIDSKELEAELNALKQLSIKAKDVHLDEKRAFFNNFEEKAKLLLQNLRSKHTAWELPVYPKNKYIRHQQLNYIDGTHSEEEKTKFNDELQMALAKIRKTHEEKDRVFTELYKDLESKYKNISAHNNDNILENSRISSINMQLRATLQLSQSNGTSSHKVDVTNNSENNLYSEEYMKSKITEALSKQPKNAVKPPDASKGEHASSKGDETPPLKTKKNEIPDFSKNTYALVYFKVDPFLDIPELGKVDRYKIVYFTTTLLATSIATLKSMHTDFKITSPWKTWIHMQVSNICSKNGLGSYIISKVQYAAWKKFFKQYPNIVVENDLFTTELDDDLFDILPGFTETGNSALKPINQKREKRVATASLVYQDGLSQRWFMLFS